MKTIETGCDVLANESFARLRGQRIGILCNYASVTSSLLHILDVMLSAGIRVERIFSPQHGFYGDAQANMIESGGFVHPRSGIPIVSLYGEHREPTCEMLEGLDTVIIDLPDVGARPYTYLWTSFLMLVSAARKGKRTLVLDRPNPIGGERIEGPLLRSDYRSFVGMAELPMRHGLTMCEALALASEKERLHLSFEAVPMRGWKRSMLFERTGLEWVLPSPNMPAARTAIVYPGMVLLEGTNISEGRGTTKPFELVGAPWMNETDYAAELSSFGIPGAVFRPACFVPMWDKYSGELCRGVQIHVVDPDHFLPVRCGVAAIAAASRLWPEKFAWKQPPYEYEHKIMPIDIIYGGEALRKTLDEGKSLDALFSSWEMEEKRFEQERKPHLLYG